MNLISSLDCSFLSTNTKQSTLQNMATSNCSQPLINDNSPTIIEKNTKKILLFSLSIVACFSLAYLGFLTIQPLSPNSTNNLSLCEKSHDPSICQTLFTQATTHASYDHHKTSCGQDLLSKILSQHVLDVKKAIKEVNKEKTQLKGVNHIQIGPLRDCLELMSMSRDRLAQLMKTLAKPSKPNPNDLNAWLSAILSNHFTCLDQLQERRRLSHSLGSTLESLISRARAILSIQVKLFEPSKGLENNLLLETCRNSRSYPSWISRRDMKLLEASGSEIEADVVVAKDGSGDFMTVVEAVAAAPNWSVSRYVIHVRAGVYEEYVDINNKENLTIVGDGMDKTVITGARYNNMTPGVTTFNSATLASNGDGFILQDICIKNTAGPFNGQAVALRINGDKSIIYRCKFDAFQDTLYPHTYRQFYRDCYITGTVDFIFGFAAAVFQNCTIVPRNPIEEGVKNMVTAQGRNSSDQNTGFSLQCCDIRASEDLAPVIHQFPTYLGRPWRNYSKVMVMQSHIGDVIDPKGWHSWDNSGTVPSTVYYAEYDNDGLGSNTSQRVNWTSFHVVTDPKEAMPFTVTELIKGKEWIDPCLVDVEFGLGCSPKKTQVFPSSQVI